MKRPGFMQGIAASAILALFTAIMLSAGMTVVAAPVLIRFLTPLVALCYLVFLLRYTPERTGKLTLLSAWLVVSVVCWWLVPSLPLYLLIHAGMIWLVRSLYYYAGVIPALLDLGLSALSVAAFFACAARTGSLALSTWCFFLTQALFVFLPADLKRRGASPDAADNGRFDRAKRQADNALRQLMS
jgi:hypothetical protein